MNRAAAWSVRGVGRETREIAEEAARRAGMSLGDWLDEVVAEQAADQGVSVDDLDEDDKLDAIGDRLSRLYRHPAAVRRDASEERRAPRSERRRSGEEPRRKQDLLEAAADDRDVDESIGDRLSRVSRHERASVAVRRDAAEDKRTLRPERKRSDEEARRTQDLPGTAEDDDDKLDAIADRLSRLSSREPAIAANRPGKDAPNPRPEPKVSAEEARRERELLEAAVAKFETRAAKSEERTAKALESVASWIEQSQADRTEERATIQSVAQKLTDIEQRSVREVERPQPSASRASRGQDAEAEIDKRLSALARRVAAPPGPRGEFRRRDEPPRIDVRDSIAQIARRQTELDSRETSARPSLTTRGAPRDFGADLGLRASGPQVRPADMPSSPDGVNVASPEVTLRKEIAALTARVERLRADVAEQTPSPIVAEDLRAGLAAMSRSLSALAPRNASVALEGAVGDFGQRLDAARKAGASDRFVAPVESMLEQVRETLRDHDPRIAAEALEREIRALGGKVEALARATVSPEVFERLRSQTEEVRNLLADAALRAVPVERLERQIGELADRVERLATSPTPHADTARVVEALSEARSQIERSTPAAALNSIERRIEQLAARMDEALERRPTMDPRPLEDLARRIEGVRFSVERQAEQRPDAAKLEAVLLDISSKLDRPAGAGADSKELTSTLRELTARLEEAFRRSSSSANFDPRPIEDLARRVEAVRATMERQGDFRPHAAKLEAALGDINSKLDRPAAADSKALTSTLQELTARLEEAFRRPAPATNLDPRPLEDLARRIESVRTTVEKQADFRPHAAKLEAALSDINSKLDRPPAAGGADSKAVASALQELTTRLEEVFRRSSSSGNFDPRPIEDLARRIEAVRAMMERQGDFRPHAAKLEAALSDINSKLDRPPVDRSDTKALMVTLQEQMARLEEAFRRPAPSVSFDPRPIEELARRIENVRVTVERQADFRPHAAKLEAALSDINSKLDRPPAAGGADSKAVATTLQELTTRLEEVFRRSSASTNFDPRPIEDLARRIEAVRTTMERQGDFRPHAAKLETALSDINSKLDRPPVDRSDTKALMVTLQDQMARLEEAFRRPVPPVDFDPRPIEELKRRIENVRETVERHADFRPHAARLEAALSDINSKLDRPLAAGTDAKVLMVTLQEQMARLEEAFGRSVPSVNFDPRPIEELERRIENVRETVERQADFRPHAAKLETALSDINSKLDRPLAAGTDTTVLTSTLQDLTARLDEAFQRPAAALKFDPEPLEDLAGRIDGLRDTIERTTDSLPDAGKLDAALADISAKLDRQAFSPDDAHALTGALQDLASRIDQGSNPIVDTAPIERILRSFGERRIEIDTAPIEEILRSFGERPIEIDTAPIEAMLRDLGEKFAASTAPVAIDTSPIERMIGRVDAKLDAVARAPMDVRPLEQAVRELHRKLDFRDAPQIDARVIEQAADLLAKRLDLREGSAIDTEALVNQISEIHGRLDSLNSAAESSAALERTVAELLDELETTRKTLQSVASANSAAPMIGDISELRAEQTNSDRRMQARLADVQDILERLVSRLGRVEDEVGRAGDDRLEPQRSTPTFGARPAMKEARASEEVSDAALRSIPDRIPRPSAREGIGGAPRGAGANSPNGGDFLLEPGRPPPRMSDTKSDSLPPARNAGINGHIAAARRAAQAALLDSAAKTEEASTSRSQGAIAGSLSSPLKHAQEFFAARRRPILLGVAFLAIVTTLAVVGLRGGSRPQALQKSELSAPVQSPAPLASAVTRDLGASNAPAGVDRSPVGSLTSARTPLPSALRPAPADLVAAIPAGVAAALHEAANAGDPGAETELGIRYLEGRTVPRDPKMAARWLEQAAAQGLPIAQYRLAALYEKGAGVARDVALARAWYLKAANAGNARAMHNLAVMDAEDGGTGKPDYAEAAKWFRRAGELGVRDSQFNLGVLYGRGLGVPQDLEQSWLWFSLASRQGDADAAKKRDEVAAKLDSKGMTAATKALTEFKEKAPEPSANEARAPAGGWDAKTDAPQSGRQLAPSAGGTVSLNGARG